MIPAVFLFDARCLRFADPRFLPGGALIKSTNRFDWWSGNFKVAKLVDPIPLSKLKAGIQLLPRIRVIGGNTLDDDAIVK